MRTGSVAGERTAPAAVTDALAGPLSRARDRAPRANIARAARSTSHSAGARNSPGLVPTLWRLDCRRMSASETLRRR